MKKAALIPLVIAGAVALSGCASATDAAPAEPTTAVVTPTTAPESPSAAPASPSAAVSPAAVTLTVVHQGPKKSVFLLDAATVAALTGIDVSAESADRTVKAIGTASTWQRSPQTAADAALIAEAATREAGSTRGAVHALTESDHARLKVVVIDTAKGRIAHIEHGNG